MEIKNKLKGYSFLGIRTLTDDENYKVGDTCRNSYDWDYENDTSSFNTDPIELPGTCSVLVLFDDLDEMTDEEIISKLNKISCNYVGEQAILIGGNAAEYGADENEIIIEDAEVIMILNK